MNMNMEIAETILGQMGSAGRLALMTGAKSFMAIDNGVQFRIGGGATKRINMVTIALNELDTYDVKFGRMVRKQGVPTYEEVQCAHGIYCDQLVELFERTTGMYLSF